MKAPPTYSVLPDTTSAEIVPVAVGSKAESTEPSDSRCASPVRGLPPTAVKVPPINQPPDPSGAVAVTTPPVTGAVVELATPVVVSMVAASPIGFELTRENVPPRYTVDGEVAIDVTAPSVSNVWDEPQRTPTWP